MTKRAPQPMTSPAISRSDMGRLVSVDDPEVLGGVVDVDVAVGTAEVSMAVWMELLHPDPDADHFKDRVNSNDGFQTHLDLRHTEDH